ncbi:precorrin-6y C5,15-methyltransferase (decarboxylating) subunit CbiE [Acidocella aquatica]|uniref:precorrin-6y C5,15-methyltransferase (decarboxylating) subunit CbiE n=1 Tax=Acidocella aquatica TaxID=1922313 RepID=UPI0024E05A5C|nr:precorrin-6y C5,15-methyltransferase (decarboxylating) subunit CbiE [Acidocella aquatica]
MASFSNTGVAGAPPALRWLTILGIGEEGVAGLSPAARLLLGQASLVVGGTRHLALAESLIRGERMVWPSPMAGGVAAILARRPLAVVVLASGDPFCDGVGSMLTAAVPVDELLSIPVSSAFSLALSRLGWPMRRTASISFCGRPLAPLAPLLQPGRNIIALSADASTPATVARFLCERGFGASRLHVMEALGGPRERIRQAMAEGFELADCDPLNVLAIEVVARAGAQVIPLSTGLPDEMFEHDGQITKREIRAVTLSALAPCAGEMLWDVGCGAGSVAVEWMLRHPENIAYGVESNPVRAARIARNALTFGVPGLRVVQGRAPGALAGLPVPDAVFLGGGAHLPGVIEAAWQALRPGGRIVANGVVIETEAALFAAREKFGGMLTRLSVERLDNIGSLHGFRPGMTVTQWAAVKP